MKINIKLVGTPTPVHTEKEKESRTTEIIRSRLKSKGLTDAQIDECFKKANARLILLLPYPAIGVKKATEMLKKDKIDIIADGTSKSKPGNYVYIMTTKDKADDLSKALRDIGRSSIHKIEVVVKSEEKVSKEKKPTNNTTEKKLAAKKKRKAENLKKFKIRKKNVRKPKKKYSKVNNPYSEFKRSKRAKRIAKAIARRKRIKASEKLKMASNDIKRKEIKNTKPVEQELQLKAA